MERKPKERDIVKLLYEENKEYERMKLCVKKLIGERCRYSVSSFAAKQYNIPYESFANTICGYIEDLQNQINELKNGKG